MRSVTTGPRAMRPNNHGLNLPELWVLVNLPSIWADYLRHCICYSSGKLINTTQHFTLYWLSLLYFSSSWLTPSLFLHLAPEGERLHYPPHLEQHSCQRWCSVHVLWLATRYVSLSIKWMLLLGRRLKNTCIISPLSAVWYLAPHIKQTERETLQVLEEPKHNHRWEGTGVRGLENNPV